MQNHERRSCVPPLPIPDPGRTGRKRWERPDVPRPAAPVRIVLASPDAVVPDLDPPEPLTALDHFMMLPCEARQDIVRGAL